MWHWILYHLGIVGPGITAPWNAFWGAIGSDFGEVTILGAVLGMYHKHNCGEPRCWRIGKYPIEGTPHVACRRHHPGLPNKVTKGHMTEAWLTLGQTPPSD